MSPLQVRVAHEGGKRFLSLSKVRQHLSQLTVFGFRALKRGSGKRRFSPSGSYTNRLDDYSTKLFCWVLAYFDDNFVV